MHFIARYIRYLKDNPERYWFKRKLYGWGWTPATWQGSATLAIFIVLIVLNFNRVDGGSRSVSDTLINFIPETAVLVLILIVVCCLTGQPSRWQWGLPEDKDPQH